VLINKVEVSDSKKTFAQGFLDTSAETLLNNGYSISDHKARSINGVCTPSSYEELYGLIQWLLEYKGEVPLYPVSTGKNWGYGSKNPVSDNCILVDLSRMNKIVNINYKTGIAIIEPGVTQKQLSQEIKGSGYRLNVTNAASETSIVGNALERGIGTSRSRVEDVIGMEVVLGNGNAVKVGGLWPVSTDDEVALSYSHGIGPNLMPLFFQSNFGVVTKMAISLIPENEKYSLIKCAFKKDKLASVYEFIRYLYDQNILNTYFKIYDSSASGTYSLEGGEEADYLLYGNIETSEEFYKVISSYLNEKMTASNLFLESHIYEDEYFEKLDNTSVDKIIYDTFRGVNDLSGFISKLFSVNSIDEIDESGHDGWLFFVPVIPADVEYLKKSIKIINDYNETTPLVISTSIKCPKTKSIDLNISIRFPRDPLMIETAHQLLASLRREFESMNLYCYRHGIDAQNGDEYFIDKHYINQLKSLKNVFDPYGIIAPGRYI